MILVNFKIYKETFGGGAIKLAGICREVASESGIKIVPTVSALDAVRIKEKMGGEVWLQNVDEYQEGKATGWVSMEQAMCLGIGGSLINHSEHQIPKGRVLNIIRHRPDGFRVVCCAKSLGQIGSWVTRGKPDYILYEPPELIASKDSSVAREKPEAIKRAVELCGKIPLVVGAGIKTGDDVRISLKMGAVGVMLASGFVLSPDPKGVLTEIASVFNSV